MRKFFPEVSREAPREHPFLSRRRRRFNGGGRERQEFNGAEYRRGSFLNGVTKRQPAVRTPFAVEYSGPFDLGVEETREGFEAVG